MAVNIEDPVIIDEKLIVLKGFTTGCNMQPFFCSPSKRMSRFPGGLIQRSI